MVTISETYLDWLENTLRSQYIIMDGDTIEVYKIRLDHSKFSVVVPKHPNPHIQRVEELCEQPIWVGYVKNGYEHNSWCVSRTDVEMIIALLAGSQAYQKEFDTWSNILRLIS